MKIWGEKPKESLGKDPEKDKTEYSRWGKSEGNPSVSWPAGRLPTVEFSTVGDSGWPTGGPFSQPESQALRRSIRVVDRTQPKANLLQSVDRMVNRSAQYTLVHVGRPLSRPTEQICSVYGRPIGRPTLRQKFFMEIFLKPSFFWQTKIWSLNTK